jgi:hypothetical protein
MNEKPTFWKSSLTSGVILGIVLIIYSVILYMLNLNMNKTLGYVNYVFIIGGLIWFTKSYRDNSLNGTMSYGQALGYSTIMVVTAALISSIYSYVLMKYIDPSLIEKIIALGEQEMINQGMSDDQIEMAQSMQKKFMQPGLMNIIGFITFSILSFIVALITSAIVKKEGDPYKSAMQEVEE